MAVLGKSLKFAIMKKIFILFVFAILISVNANSQSVGALGNFIIEQDDFMTARNLLIRSGFTLFSNNELKAFGHNPSIKVIGTKGLNPSNSIMANITLLQVRKVVKLKRLYLYVRRVMLLILIQTFQK